MKRTRQNKILSIITEKDIETQEQLLAELRQLGLSATQATISRDIKELRLVKELTGIGAYRYVVSERKNTANEANRLQTIFKESVTAFEAAQNIVVINTMPGLASAACAALDNMEIEDMLGSIAGDDTGILIMRSKEAATAFCSEIHKMLK